MKPVRAALQFFPEKLQSDRIKQVSVWDGVDLLQLSSRTDWARLGQTLTQSDRVCSVTVRQVSVVWSAVTGLLLSLGC